MSLDELEEQSQMASEVRYLWSVEAKRFRPAGIRLSSGEAAYKALDQGGLGSQEAEERLKRQGQNAIRVKVLRVFQALLAEYGQPSLGFLARNELRCLGSTSSSCAKAFRM